MLLHRPPTEWAGFLRAATLWSPRSVGREPPVCVKKFVVVATTSAETNMMRSMALVGAAALGVGLLYLLRKKKSSRRNGNAEKLAKLRSGTDLGSESGVFFNSVDAPLWLRPLFSDSAQRRVLFREWEDVEWRKASGWKGRDLIHSPDGRGVQVLAYFWDDATMTLTGIVRFGPDAESHRGLCHGGAMTSLMDDLCGHSELLTHLRSL